MQLIVTEKSPADCRSILDRHEPNLATVLVASLAQFISPRNALRLFCLGKMWEIALMVMGSTPTVDPRKKSPLITDLKDLRNSSFFQVYRNGLDTNIVQNTIHDDCPKHNGHRDEESRDENPKNRLGRKNKNKAHCKNVKAESLVLSGEWIRKIVHDLEIQNTDSFHAYLHTAEDFKVAVHHNQSLSDDSKRKCTSSKPTGQNRHRCSLHKQSIFSIPTPLGWIPKGRDPREQEAQGDQPRSCDHPFDVSLLIQALIHSRGFGDQNVPVDRNKRVGEQRHGDSQKQQRFFERLVADHQKSPSGGDHCFVGHPESTNQQIRHAAVHDKRITGCAELLERHHQIDHQEVEDGSQNTHERVDCGEGDARATSQSTHRQRHVCVVWHDGRCVDNVISSYRISHCERNECVRECSSLWRCCGGESRCIYVRAHVCEREYERREINRSPRCILTCCSLFPGCTITMKASNYS